MIVYDYDGYEDPIVIPYDIEPTLVNCCNDEEECNGITEFPDFCPRTGPPSSMPSELPSVSFQPSSMPSESPSVSFQPSSMTSESTSVSDQPSSIPSKSGKSAKSTKSVKVADEIIQADLNFQGIKFSMMAGDESLSYDQSVDVGLLSFEFSEGEGSK